jgi:hypothetical protein
VASEVGLTTHDDELALWIATVRERLTSGALADLAPISVGEGYPSLPGELYVRIMVADYDHYDDLTLERRRAPETVALRLALLADLRRLRELIG